MGVGTGIFLLAVGAILAFAVADRIGGVNLVVVGYICMGAGALSLVIGLVLHNQRTNTRHTEVIDRHEHRHNDGTP